MEFKGSNTRVCMGVEATGDGRDVQWNKSVVVDESSRTGRSRWVQSNRSGLLWPIRGWDECLDRPCEELQRAVLVWL
jgi:hypothetical protein